MTTVTKPATLSVSGLTKAYGAKSVLGPVNLDVVRGETVAVIGPSGSGKTTLLRCAAYLEVPSAGTVRIDGELIGQAPGPGGALRPLGDRKLARQRRAIGFVFQRFNLFPHLSALDNVAIGLHRVHGLPRSTARARARQELDKVFLGAHVDKRPAELSGGQQQRVAIARAMASDPAVFLFDEPTSALDPELVREVLDVIQALAADGRTLVIVTHELPFARRVASRIVFMDNGVIVEEGSPEAVLGAPREERTRRFLEHFHPPTGA